MAMELLVQNAKALMENIYEYERLLAGDANKKDIEQTRKYALRMIESIRKIMEAP